MPIRDIPWLPPSPQSPQDWEEWEKLILEHRISVLYGADHGVDGLTPEAVRAREITRCDLSGEYMANTYGMIYEARGEEGYQENLVYNEEDDSWLYNEEDIRSGIIPYVQYPFQIDFFDWMTERMLSRGPMGDGVVIKARDMGLSNSIVFWIAHKWLFRRPFQARLLSRNERLVDQTGDPDSLFWKLDTYLMGLPSYIFDHGAPGFDWRQHRLMLRLMNPANGNLVSGESTQADAGRGGRATVNRRRFLRY